MLPMTGCSRATVTAIRWPGTGWLKCPSAPPINGAKPALTGNFQVDGRRCVPVFQLVADRYLEENYSPEAVAERCGVAADTIRRDRRRTGACRLRTGDRTAGGVDRLGRPPARDDQGPAGVDARDARHLGPFERFSYLPRHPPAASTPGYGGRARRISLQAALSAVGAARAEAGGQGSSGR